MLADMDIPDLTSMQTIEIDMNSDSDKYPVPDDMLKLMQDSDVTTITENTKTFASTMFAEISPDLISDINGGIDSGTSGMTTARSDMDDTIAEMQEARDELGTAISEMDSAVSQQENARSQMEEYLPMLENVENYSSVLDLIPASAKAAIPQQVLDQLADVKTASDLQAKIDELQSAMDTLTAKITQMQSAYDGIETGIQQMQGALAGVNAQIAADEAALAKATDPATIAQLKGKIAGEQKGADSLQTQIDDMTTQAAGLKSGIDGMKSGLASQKQAKGMMEEYLPTLQKMDNYSSVLDLMPDSAKSAMPSSVLDQLSSVKTSSDLEGKIEELDSAIDAVQSAQDEMRSAQDGIQSGIDGIESAQDEIGTTMSRMAILKVAVPDTFAEADRNYRAAIDERSDQIQDTFQGTLNEGFKGMFQLVAIFAAIGLVLLAFYHEKPRTPEKQAAETPAAG